ncbi:Fur family transcriptional regulator, zinc uptake regulator [Izhakiella capsodis]|uniref:Fur family transcriptional regulator, zinc uptake regulator n=1 Tax=Izhakiella capsodis TaxID=1367852 RepID=A0A1I4X3N7_9GAMM|nr:zinc uptake transcriptional repressor Zur [Izhakiella capsodis]SFN20631.1 Fur family transcriptional regulator, zinc uptake regulator [Izhakiella capsodis]
MATVSAEHILGQAEKLCQQRNVRMTPQRMEVLRLMTLQSGAISAYDLLDLLRISEPQAKPPTIYRALDFLLEQGFIHRVESTNSYMVCHHFEGPAHISAMLICQRCGSVAEQHADGIEAIIATLASRERFALRNMVIEAHGLCADCSEVEACTQQESCQHDHSVAVAAKKRGR